MLKYVVLREAEEEQPAVGHTRVYYWKLAYWCLPSVHVCPSWPGTAGAYPIRQWLSGKPGILDAAHACLRSAGVVVVCRVITMVVASSELEALRAHAFPTAAAGLCHLSTLTNLRHLNVAYSAAGDAALAALSGLPTLTVLNLDSCPVTDR